MELLKACLIFAFILVSCVFYTQFNKEELDDLIDILDTLTGTECPIGISLYRFKIDGHAYRIQIQRKLPHNLIQKAAILKRCEREKIIENSDDNIEGDFQNVDAVNFEDFRLETTSKLDRICEKAYDVSERTRFSQYFSNAQTSNAVLAYLLEVIKWPDTADVSEYNQPESDMWSIQTLSRGIFPGTLWCGFGNVADDMFGQLGDHANTDNCCRSHDLCRPIIKAFQTRFYYSNPSFLPISHCGCDLDFYKCLLKVNTPTSRTIGKIFFNLVKMKCFDFDIRDVCTASFLGLCTTREKRCVAVLKSNTEFPT